MSTRIGVDIGGTFTDLVYYDDVSGRLGVAKVPTTSANPEEGCIHAVEVGVSQEVLSGARYFLHGTTVGLNALLERRGPTMGLLATAGFRDVLEIRNARRGEPYNIFWRPKDPLVPRDLRIAIKERVTFDGRIQQPLEEADVLGALETFERAGVTSIAIAFLHSYANQSHELRAAQILRDAGFPGHISLSHQISGEYRDYERTSTTVVDAFVRARMASYLDHIDTTLRGKGFNGIPLMMRSGTGSMSFKEAQLRPFETINSGPVGGAEGAAELSRRLGLPNLITADVGGTSFDAALIINGRPRILNQGEIDGMPLQTHWVDVRSIGSGGGSIAEIDVGGLMTVGPRSAGAQPGPACYGRGGELPTTTDAAFYLGMLGNGALASGLMLDRDAAEQALEPLGEKMGSTAEEAAKGIITIASSHMASLIRELTMEQGVDAREFSLLPFGGAGPMLATQIARELDIREILIPPHAGNFSAWGLLGADLLKTRARTRIMQLGDDAIVEANEIAASLLEILNQGEDDDGAARDDVISLTFDMRYVGQEHTLSVAATYGDGRITDSAACIHERFGEQYRQANGATLAGTVEIVTIRAARRRALPRCEEMIEARDAGEAGSGEYFSFYHDKRVLFTTLNRSDLQAGDRRQGPAIIYEETTTTYVDADFTYEVDDNGCLSLKTGE